MEVELERLTGRAPDDLAALVDAAVGADGVNPFVQALDLLETDVLVRHAVKLGGRLAGYAAAAPTPGDPDLWRLGLVVGPQARENGFGELLAQTVADAADDAGAATIEAWAPTVTESVDRLAYRTGFRLVRRLLKISIALPLAERVPLPRGYSLSSIRDADLEGIVEVNNSAFSWHPEQGNLTVDDLVAVRSETWYDPTGFLVARDADGDLAGFCWTKMHSDPRPAGEIFVICVAPEHSGVGLGKALTVSGLEHIAESCDTGMLYVDEGNLAARAVYASLGFELERIPSMFRLDLAERIRPQN